VPEIFVDLQAGIAELDGGVTLTLSGIENVYLGGYWGHEAWGNQFANRLTASLGDDALYGAGGADILQGASGNDTLDGGGGDDILEGGWHDDTLIGGAGVDTALFGAEGEDMVVDLALGTAVGQGSDTLTQIENVTTGDGGDWIGGSDVANVLLAGDGNDEVHGLGGNDQLEGGSGHDTLTGGADNDTMLGGSDNDTLNGEGGNDTLNGGSGFDIVDGGTGIDTLTGFHHVDNFVFALGDSSIGAGFRHVITDFSTV
jgi:serralysin